MDLSVIIVNYNVRYFLEQSLHAVMTAIQKVQAEVILVDNNSADGSLSMVTEKFPQVICIANDTNEGFSRANNQAIRIAKGKYILLLNPDTVVQEDSFVKCIEYMDQHTDVGCLGVKMIDGKGNFLPESKRSLPTPEVAFYKVFGLSALFPRSHKFGRYHLGFLNRDEIHEVDVISGAFMFMRREALEKTGLLDEAFFMYGEDIDLSYRFKLAGFRNMYFPLTTIIHYKGESTKKSSINYVIVFYRAMIIFARKHFAKNTARYYSLFISLAIYLRAFISILKRFIANIATPLLDALTIYLGFVFLLPVWENHRFGDPEFYPPVYLGWVVPAYIAIWMFSVFITTGYEKRSKLTDLVRGILSGTMLILVIYALLPESWRFSRALILIGTLLVTVSMITVRLLIRTLNRKSYSFEFSRKKKRIVIIGNKVECERVYAIIQKAQVIPELVGYVSPSESITGKDYLGHLGQIGDIVRINQADELIFCSASVLSQEIIRTMLQFTDTGIEFKIAPPESLSVIGSSSNEVPGELYVLHFNTLSRLLNRRKKRLFDILFSLSMLAGSPLIVFLVKNPGGLFRNIAGVLLGFASWVGYFQTTGGYHPGLPRIKPGILTPVDLYMPRQFDTTWIEQINLLYAKDYRIANDIKTIIKGFKNLGRKYITISEH